MNKERRATAQKSLSTLEDIQYNFHELLDAEENAYANIPENLLETEKAEKISENINNLEEIIFNLDEILGTLESLTERD